MAGTAIARVVGFSVGGNFGWVILFYFIYYLLLLFFLTLILGWCWVFAVVVEVLVLNFCDGGNLIFDFEFWLLWWPWFLY